VAVDGVCSAFDRDADGDVDLVDVALVDRAVSRLAIDLDASRAAGFDWDSAWFWDSCR
jgi:hypothetical protein